MKMTIDIKRKWERIIGILLVLIIVSTGLGLLTYIYRPADTDQCIMQIEAFHSLPENSVEVMIYGSSHAWRGVNQLVMYDEYGIGAYNYAANWQSLATEELFFYDSLRTQKPKVALIETFLVNHTLRDSEMCGEIYYTRAIPAFDKKSQYLKRAFGNNYDRYLAYYFPLSQFHSAWNTTNVAYFTEYYSTEEFVNTMGYYQAPYDEINQKAVTIGDPDSFSQMELYDEAVEMLDSIVETCRKENIIPVFFTMPYEGEYIFEQAMNDYCESRGCDYINLFRCMDETGLNPETDFGDGDHTNDLGARKVGAYLGKYLNENYELTDMREIPGNMWGNKLGNRVGYKWIEMYNPELLKNE